MPRIDSAAGLGSVVRAARVQRRMTQQDLALAAGVSRRWVVDLEAGKPRAELGLVLAVLTTLGVPLTADTPDFPFSAASATSRVFDLDQHLNDLAGSP